MDEQTAVKRVLAEYEKLVHSSPRIRALEKKLAEGTITMKEASELNRLRAEVFGKAFSGNVIGIDKGSREPACMELLRGKCDDVDELARIAQQAMYKKQGMSITPPKEGFPDARAFKIAHSLEDETVPDETIQRRARSASENILNSQYDNNMKRGAKTAADAGLKTFIVRTDPGCCDWCAKLVERYVYGTEPKDVYCRHDNCSCSVVYESNRGKQNVWSKQTWSKEQEQKYLELRDELKAKKMTAAPDVKKPVRLSEKEVQAIINKVGGLTFGGKSATMYYDHITDFNGSENLPPVTLAELEKRISVIPDNLQKELSQFVSRIHMGEEKQTSGYSPINHDIRLNPKTGAESLIHELGHAFGDMRNLYNDPEFIDVLTDGLDLSNGYGINTLQYNDMIVGIIRSPKFVNPQQGRVYADFTKMDYSKPVPPVLMQEYISEGFDAFFNRPEELKSKDPKLYSYLERSIYGKINK